MFKNSAPFILITKDVWAIGHIECTVGIGNKGEGVGAFDFEGKPEEVIREVFAICDNLGGEFIKEECCFE